jgi:hypothetical protein
MTRESPDVVTLERTERTVNPSGATHVVCLTCDPGVSRGLCGAQLRGDQRLPHMALDCVVCADLLGAGHCPHCGCRFGPS